MTPFPVVSAIFRIVDSVFGTKPTKNSIKSDLRECTDKFEVATPLPPKTARVALGAIDVSLKRIDERERKVLSLLGHIDSDQFCLRTFRQSLTSAMQQYEVLMAKNENSKPVAPHEILSIRRRLLELDGQIDDLQAEGIAKALQSCSPIPRARIQVMVLLDAICRDEGPLVLKLLQHSVSEAEAEASNDKTTLARFDASVLRIFAQKGFVAAMSIPEYNASEKKIETLSKIETRQLREQFFRGDSFYRSADAHYTMLRDFASLLKTARVAILSKQAIQKQIVESLFRGHLELFCGLGVIERLSYAEVSRMTQEHQCVRQEVFRIDKTYWRIPPDGIQQLKNAIRITLD